MGKVGSILPDSGECLHGLLPAGNPGRIFLPHRLADQMGDRSPRLLRADAERPPEFVVEVELRSSHGVYHTPLRDLKANILWQIVRAPLGVPSGRLSPNAVHVAVVKGAELNCERNRPGSACGGSHCLSFATLGYEPKTEGGGCCHTHSQVLRTSPCKNARSARSVNSCGRVRANCRFGPKICD